MSLVSLSIAYLYQAGKLADRQLHQTIEQLKRSQGQEVQQLNDQIKTLKDQVQAKAEAKVHLAAVEAAQQAQAVPAVTYTAPYIQTAYAAPVNGYKAFIYQHESGNNPGSINASSGACGLGQALPCSKLPCSLSDYACQDNWFTGYALARYGSWEQAYYFWVGHAWW